MDQHQQHFSLSEKEYATINHFTDIFKNTLLVQQEILAQITLLNNRVLSIEHKVNTLSRDSRNNSR